jgi:hypothetical protein
MLTDGGCPLWAFRFAEAKASWVESADPKPIMTGRYGDLDYPTLAKRGTLLGLCLFVVGAAGELGAHAMGLQLQAWEATLLFDAEVLGVALFLLSPLVFGVALPLTE